MTASISLRPVFSSSSWKHTKFNSIIHYASKIKFSKIILRGTMNCLYNITNNIKVLYSNKYFLNGLLEIQCHDTQLSNLYLNTYQ